MVGFEFLYLLVEIFLVFGLVGLLFLGLLSFSNYSGSHLEPYTPHGWSSSYSFRLISSSSLDCFRPFFLAIFSTSLVVLVATAYYAFCHCSGFLRVLFYGAYDFSPFVGFGKFLVVATFVAFLIILLVFFDGGRLSKRVIFPLNFEAMFLVGLMLLASFTIVSSSNFMIFYVNLEFQTFILYILVSFDRSSPRSTESGLHYLILGALSTGVLLFGISLFYGATSILNFYESSVFFSLIDADLDLVRLGVWAVSVSSIFLLFSSFLFKLSMAPFHFWTPRVYEGAPTPIMIFVSVFGKFSILFVFVKILVLFGLQGYSFYPLFFSPYELGLSGFFFHMALLTVILGSVGGLYQSRFKSLWGYSAITNFGFVALALGGLTGSSYAAAILYLTFYILVNFVFFFVYSLVKAREGSIWTEPRYLGQFAYFRSASRVAHFIVCFVLISFLSFPPLLNFLAKFYVLCIVYSASFSFGLGYLIVFLLANLISSFYYLRLYRFMSVKGAGEYEYSSVFYRVSRPFSWFPIIFSLFIYIYAMLSSGQYFSFLSSLVDGLLLF